MPEQREVTITTRRWLEKKLTAEEITTWGAPAIRALGALIDSLEDHTDDH